MVHTLVISVPGMQIKVKLWGSLDRQANPLQEFLALERLSSRKSWMVPEKTPKVFFCPPYGGHIPTHLHSGERDKYTRIMWQKCGSKSSCIPHAENKQWTPYHREGRFRGLSGRFNTKIILRLHICRM